MVLKRKLPSRLTQDNKPDVEQIEPASSPDVFEDNIEETAAPSKPESNPMKRQVKSRRERGQGIAKMKEQALASSPKESTDEKMEDLPPVAAHPDAEEALSTTMADLKGETPNPANEDMEAAYISPAVEDAPKPAPNFDLSKTTEELANPAEFPEPTPIESKSENPPSIEDMPAPQPLADIEPKTENPVQTEPSIPAPPSFAEETKAEESSTNWDFGEFSAPVPETTQEASNPPIAPATANDPYKDIGTPTTPSTLPTSDNSPPELPPELPSSPAASVAGTLRRPSGGIIKLFVLVAAVLLVVVMVVVVRSGDKTRAGIKKFSDSYADVQKDIPVDIADEVKQLEFEMDDAMAKLKAAAVIPKSVQALGKPMPTNSSVESNIKVDFVDVTAKEAAKPITASNETMPEDIGAIARLQREITRLKSGENPAPKAGETAPKADAGVMSKRELDAELSAYRKALMQSDGINKEIPKPSEFGVGKEIAENNLQELTTNSQNDLPPNTRYLENPYELPVIAEPEGSSVPQIRTLNDFELALSAPEKGHVRIPKGVKPRMSATDFPEIEVLSFIPDKGIIATNKGMQGVLLIGEVIEGWELVSVSKGYAEFMNGKRKRVVTWD